MGVVMSTNRHTIKHAAHIILVMFLMNTCYCASEDSPKPDGIREKISHVLAVFGRITKPESIIPLLLSVTTKLDKLSHCIISGTDCGAQRAALITASITFFVLSAILAGTTLTVATTSHVISNYTQKTSQEVKGWGLNAVVQRLRNTLEAGKQQLMNLKQCFRNRTCPSDQKRALYASAVTTTALAILTVELIIRSSSVSSKN